MVVSKSVRLIEQGQTACNSWRLTLRSQAGRALSLHATSSPANSIAVYSPVATSPWRVHRGLDSVLDL
jgi:hypothetical protein